MARKRKSKSKRRKRRSTSRNRSMSRRNPSKSRATCSMNDFTSIQSLVPDRRERVRNNGSRRALGNDVMLFPFPVYKGKNAYGRMRDVPDSEYFNQNVADIRYYSRREIERFCNRRRNDSCTNTYTYRRKTRGSNHQKRITKGCELYTVKAVSYFGGGGIASSRSRTKRRRRRKRKRSSRSKSRLTSTSQKRPRSTSRTPAAVSAPSFGSRARSTGFLPRGTIKKPEDSRRTGAFPRNFFSSERLGPNTRKKLDSASSPRSSLLS